MKAEKVVAGYDPVANKEAFGSNRSECNNFSHYLGVIKRLSGLTRLSYDPLFSQNKETTFLYYWNISY